MGWAGQVAHMGQMRNACNIFVGKPEGKRPLGRPRHTWEVVDWFHLPQDRDHWWALQNTVMNLQVSQKAQNS
jgi:hypothetical protein